uniref:Putative alcohol dehydrogenase transcription factor myb/sant-like protein n=1 Tax=Triatoma infestans TaxID=30076 RepID=A0A023F0P8_TRIIF
MSSIPNLPIWMQFFDAWRDLPEIWKIKSEIYKDKTKKKNAWEKLLSVYLEIDKNANLDSLKKRLTNIRTCYRRELKKILQAEKSGAGGENEYEPNLWYFSELDFLRDQEVQIPGVSTIEVEDDHEIEASDSVECIEPKSLSYKRKKKAPLDIMAERNNILKDAVQTMNLGVKKDDASVYSESWAVSFRKLSANQQLFAKKAIDEILILGQLGQLSLNSVNAPSSSNSSTHSSSCSTPLHNNSRSSTPYIPASTPSTSQCENLPIVEVELQPTIMRSENYASYEQLLSDSLYR